MDEKVGREEVFTLKIELERETEEIEFRTQARRGPGFSLRKVIVRHSPVPAGSNMVERSDGASSSTEEHP